VYGIYLNEISERPISRSKLLLAAVGDGVDWRNVKGVDVPEVTFSMSWHSCIEDATSRS